MDWVSLWFILGKNHWKKKDTLYVCCWTLYRSMWVESCISTNLPLMLLGESENGKTTQNKNVQIHYTQSYLPVCCKWALSKKVNGDRYPKSLQKLPRIKFLQPDTEKESPKGVIKTVVKVKFLKPGTHTHTKVSLKIVVKKCRYSSKSVTGKNRNRISKKKNCRQGNPSRCPPYLSTMVVLLSPHERKGSSPTRCQKKIRKKS